MEFTIEINHLTCIRCGKCVRICPALIFQQPGKQAQVEVHNPQTCIRCGHCVAICPTDSVIHSVFPPEKVHAFEREQLPTPEQLMLLIKSRRSNRAFSAKPVPEELLDQIVEAAHRAPTASNGQELSFTLVTDPAVLQQIIHLTVEVFEEKIRLINNSLVRSILQKAAPKLHYMVSMLNKLVDAVKEGKDPILRGATSVLFIHAPKENYYGRDDANLAYQNGSLLAESLGVSQFYTGFVCRAIMEDKKQRFNKLLGIEGKIHAGLAMGMPSFKFAKYIDREEIRIKKI